MKTYLISSIISTPYRNASWLWNNSSIIAVMVIYNRSVRVSILVVYFTYKHTGKHGICHAMRNPGTEMMIKHQIADFLSISRVQIQVQSIVWLPYYLITK